jgi:hypothetical protein
MTDSAKLFERNQEACLIKRKRFAQCLYIDRNAGICNRCAKGLNSPLTIEQKT